MTQSLEGYDSASADNTARFRFLLFLDSAETLTAEEIVGLTGSDKVIALRDDIELPQWARHEDIVRFSRYAPVTILYAFLGDVPVGAPIYMLPGDVPSELLLLRVSNLRHRSFEVTLAQIAELSRATETIIYIQVASEDLDSVKDKFEHCEMVLGERGILLPATMPELDDCYAMVDLLQSRIREKHDCNFEVIEQLTGSKWA